jgi:predicted TPR repeat methyltransferase
MGTNLAAVGQPGPAANAYRLAIRLRPEVAGLYMNLGNVLIAAGDFAGAAETFRDCAARCPNDPVARHMLAALSGEAAPDRANDGYVAATFDGFAATFDATLVGRLDYQGPALIRTALDRHLGDPDGTRDVLDAGCGTGLCAPLLRPFARRLDGVDLSGEMLERATARALYDRLDRAELCAHLAAHPRAWDAIVAADVFSYFGDLAGPFRAAAAALRPGGALVATVEQEDAAPAGFTLRQSGRYGHTRTFLEACARGAGLDLVSCASRILRRERGVPVPALVFILAHGAAGRAKEHKQ